MPAFADTVNPPLAELLAPLHERARAGAQFDATPAGRFIADGRCFELPRFRFFGAAASHEPVRLGLFAGVHGDEPAGCLALARLLRDLLAEPGRARGYELFVYPLVNPVGYEAGTRVNGAGLDLNREFWRGSVQPEVQIIEAELRAHRFAGLIALHADDTCEGHYGYSHGCSVTDALLRPALLAAEKILPRDRRDTIDGFVAREGVIRDCYHGILSAPPEQEPRPFNVIFETPAHAPLDLQVSANVAALEAIIATYRGSLSYAQDI